MSDRLAAARARVRAHRQRKRDAGLRLVQYWVPDVESPAFKEQARRDCERINGAEDSAEAQRFINSHLDWFLGQAEWDAPL